MDSKNILIKVNQLYKIFGDGDKSALNLVKMVWVKTNSLRSQTVFSD